MIKYLYLIAGGLLGNENTLGIPGTQATNSKLRDMFSIAFVIIGALALLVIVVAGLSFVTSQGDPQKTGRARNAIIYASIGLVLAAMSWVIVETFVERVG